MAYIYKVTNKNNGKIYVGKTNQDVKHRWKQHCNDFKRTRNEKRPLYAAIKKYGSSAFEISIIEEVISEKSSDREIYWINTLGSYKNGYNATKGGDGTIYIDYDLVERTFNNLGSVLKTTELLGIHEQTVRKILKQRNIRLLTRSEIGKQASKPVGQYTLDNEVIAVFGSSKEAARRLNLRSCNISRTCNGKRKTAYGCLWRFI